MTAHPTLFPWTRQLVRAYVNACSSLLFTLGMTVNNAKQTLAYVFKWRVSRKHYLEQAAVIGVGALGIAVILTLFSGMVIALQVAKELIRQGGSEYVGALVSISIIRELAPIMTGFAVIAMIGSAYTAEIATMRIQSQIDALKVLHMDPIRYLVVPRILAAITMLPLMTVLTSLAGIIGGMVVSYFIADLNYNTFMESVWQQTQMNDLYGAMLKSSVFGFLIVLIATSFGLYARGGSREVGLFTTRSVVWSFIAMAIADYILSMLLFDTV